MHFWSAGWGNGKLSNLKYLNKNVNIVSKTLIYGAHEAIPYAPELSVFGTVGAHEAWSCAFRFFFNIWEEGRGVSQVQINADEGGVSDIICKVSLITTLV